ncbi:uncharacterized protein LOC125674135 isoform X1 [Ostrea edulis]|uniref:uncharacterized protein LOC125674135 isoform X1 n=1 Tax=Ostrea edulis TaxID=37623 RepID=UPI0024AFAA99|nr:uncharacterized protein LOC125674135 isoform X1 [Ostrea edulis]
MGVADKILERNGYKLTRFSDDKNSFYYILHSVIKSKDGPPSDKAAMQMQDDLFRLEEENSLYFHLFLPESQSCDGTLFSKDCLHSELTWLKKRNRSPSPREIFAAAELLQKSICIIHFDRSQGDAINGFKGYIFAPVIRQCMDAEPLCILMVEKEDGCAEFVKIDLKDRALNFETCPGTLRNKTHRNCFGLRFTNNFSKLFDGHVTYGAKDDVKDLYRRLSLEFYGTEEHHHRILNIICNFELEQDNLELFSKYANNTVNDETDRDEKEKLLKIHIKNSRQRLKRPGEGELYALSSVFNVDIVIDKTGRGDWDTYMSVACTYASCFNSPIILRKQTKEGYYMPYVTTPGKCSCCQKKPETQGHIGIIKENVHKAVLKNPCCPAKGNHKNHTHLNHIPQARTFWPKQTNHLIPTDDIQVAITRLEAEKRRIDQINGGDGTIAKAMAKELYGDENKYFGSGLQDALGDEKDDMDKKMQRFSDWLTVPIYVYHGTVPPNQMNSSQGFFWTRFEPVCSETKQLKRNKDCRFYITLFHNRLNGSLDRITPLRGCNCQLPPPLSLLRDHQTEMESQLLLCVAPKQRHHPLVTFLSIDPSNEMFTIEIRDFPECSPYSPMRIAMEREDMKGRTFDSVQFYERSLIQCLSKEIFGTEQRDALILKELCNEISMNIQIYLPVFGENINHAYKTIVGKWPQDEKDYGRLAKFLIERIEDDLPSDDFLLWVACTYFQTSIYVLRVSDSKTSTESFWTEYPKLRIRRKDRIKPTRFDMKCPKTKTYYISLLQTGTKQFHRIVPKMACCNCVVDIPIVPRRQADSTKYHTQQDCKLMREIRKMDTLLDSTCVSIEQWLLCNRNLQTKCDAVICEIEGRRKNVNIATISGSSAGLVGAWLAGIGIALAPATGGFTTLLTVGGGALAVSGGAVAAGAKITESVLNKGTVDTLNRYQSCYQERFERLQSSMEQLTKEVKRLEEETAEFKINQNIQASDFTGIQCFPGILRTVKGLAMIPIGVLKVSARGITILGVIIGPLTALFDAGLLAFAVRNMSKGNRTDLTENLRQISASLYGSRRQMQNWAFGNQRAVSFD